MSDESTPVDAHDPEHRARLEALLAEHSTLSGQTHALTRDDWKVLFSREGAAIPLHVRPFTLLAWRDPIGPAHTWHGALAELRAHASRVGKHAVVLAASDTCRAVAESLGFSSIFNGSEQMFDLARFSTRGKKGEKLRLATNHARRHGLSVREIFPTADAASLDQLTRVEAIWKRARTERQTTSFLRTDPMENAHMRRYFGAFQGDEMQGFLVCAPVSRRGFYLQDLVRLPDATRGAAELMSVHALETFAREGRELATMGIVPFYTPRGVHRPVALSSAAAFCVRYFDAAFRFKGLQQFRAKFPATEHVPVHTLVWPRVLNPLCAWDIVGVLGRGSKPRVELAPECTVSEP
ncbi:MAG: phosphatidylglycerol lysyltransferase domain-containing protein [Polyangiales bacterium]